jgi:RNA polymerase sigma-70 factor (ECF subfamily)
MDQDSIPLAAGPESGRAPGSHRIRKNLNAPAPVMVLSDERASWRMAHLSQAVFEEPRLAKQDEAARDDAGLCELIERQSRFIFRLAYALLRNAHDAEDVVQETFLRVHRTGAWKHMSNERAFLARTAWRIALKRLPKRPNVSSEFEIASADRNPEDAAIAADWEAVVHRLVDALPEELRRPLVLSGLQELNSREISRLLGVPEGTVRTRILRARQILKQKLATLMERRNEK